METETEDSPEWSHEASEGTNPTDTLILNFQAPELQEDKFLMVKQPTLWYFVVIQQTNTFIKFKLYLESQTLDQVSTRINPNV